MATDSKNDNYYGHTPRSFGLVLLALVVLLWVGSSVSIQVIYKELDYQKPFLLTYYSTALFSIYLLGFLSPSWWKQPSTNDLSIDDEYVPSSADMLLRRHPITTSHSDQPQSHVQTPQHSPKHVNLDPMSPHRQQPSHTPANTTHAHLTEKHAHSMPHHSQRDTINPRPEVKPLLRYSDDWDGGGLPPVLSTDATNAGDQGDYDSVRQGDWNSTSSPVLSSTAGFGLGLDSPSLGPESPMMAHGVRDSRLSTGRESYPDENGIVEVVDDDSNGDGGGKGDEKEKEMMPYQEVAKLALIFCPFWFLANTLYNSSLALTSVTSNTLLSTTSGLFTLLGSVLFLKDDMTGFKMLAVILSFSGVALISTSDEDVHNGKDTILGDLLALSSAIAYAMYILVLKAMVKDEERLRMTMFFGFVGLFNMLLFWPCLFMYHYTDLETFELPSLQLTWVLTLQALVGTVLSDYLWARAVLLTSPLAATIALSLTIPLAMVADTVMGKTEPTWPYIIGSIGIFAGFLLANIGGADNKYDVVITLQKTWKCLTCKFDELKSGGGGDLATL
eukprot:GFYU01005751.1.p1 GENE.GFYU01005751.1~~GFYU01005751.1.p1  ORF type:complete len:558 (-),score=126.96 GFYU01005751.1:132-1805(-)